jgi:hypothetical protein
MKIFVVNNNLELEVYRSEAAFLKVHKWTGQGREWVKAVMKSDLASYVDCQRPARSGVRIHESEEEVAANYILHGAAKIELG